MTKRSVIGLLAALSLCGLAVAVWQWGRSKRSQMPCSSGGSAGASYATKLFAFCRYPTRLIFPVRQLLAQAGLEIQKTQGREYECRVPIQAPNTEGIFHEQVIVKVSGDENQWLRIPLSGYVTEED